MRRYKVVRAMAIPVAVMVVPTGAVHAADGSWIGGNGV
jgi:hypothetical protein